LRARSAGPVPEERSGKGRRADGDERGRRVLARRRHRRLRRSGSVDIRRGSRVCLPEHSMEATVIDGDLRSVGNRHTSDPIRLDRST